jgi:prolyl oligopeptidase
LKAEFADCTSPAPGRFCDFVGRLHTTFLRFFLPIFFLIASVTTVNAQDAKAKCPSVARIEDVAETIHGTVVHDPYRWLEEQDSPETRAWIDAENACTQAVLAKVPGQDAIARRLGELIKVDTIGLPIERGGRYFYAKRAANQDLFVLYMRRGAKGAEEVLVDPTKLSADHTTSVNFEGISDDGKLIGYGVRKGGEDEVSLHFLDTDTGKERKDALPRARYISSPTFRKDKSGFYYSKHTDEGPRAYFHAMGTDFSQDTKIFGDGYTPDKILAVDVSEDERYLLFSVFYGSACDRSEVYFQDFEIAGPITPVVNTLDGCFQGAIAGDTLYLQTNWKAPKWRVMAVPLRTPSQEHWKEIIAEGESRLEDFRLAGGKIVTQYSHNAASELKIFQADGGRPAELRCRSWEPWRELWGDGNRTRRSFRFNRSRYRRRFIATIWPRGHWKCGPSRRCRSMRARLS